MLARILQVVLCTLLPATLLYAADPKVERGSIDLSNWDGKQSFHLDGDWLVAEDQLLEGPAIAAALEQGLPFIPVPTPLEYKANEDLGHFQRTMVLHIKNLRSDRPLSLYLPYTSLLSHRFLFYQNSASQQHVMAEFGHVDADPAKRIHVYSGNNEVQLPAVNGDGILIIQANAYPYFKGVIYPWGQNRLLLGEAASLKLKAKNHFLEVSFVLGLFVLMAIFNLALFIQRPTERGNLYLMGLAAFLAWRFCSTEGFLFQIIGQPNFFLFQLNTAGLAYSPILASAALSLFLRATYPRQVPRVFPYLHGIVVCGLLVDTFLIHSLNFTQSRWVYPTIITLGLFLFACYTALRAALAQEPGANLGVLGFACVFVAHVNDFFVATGVYDSLYFGHYSVIVMIFMQSLIVGKRFALTFDRAIIMGRELQTKNSALEIQQAEIKTLNQSLKEYAETLEFKVEEKTRDIVSILNNIRQGILAICSPNGELAAEHSRYLEPMLGITGTAGHNVMDVCFRQTNLGADRLDQMKNALAMMVGEEPLAFDLNSDALPTEISRPAEDGTDHTFELDWSPVIAGQRIEKILLVIRDVTEIKGLRMAAENQASELGLIADIIKVPKDRFEPLVAAAERLLDANRDLLVRLERVDDTFVDRLYRNLHTVKGMMRTYQLSKITDLVHAAEDRYKRMKQGESIEAEILRRDIEQILAMLAKMQQISRQKLGRSQIQDNRFILIDRVQFEANLSHIKEIDIKALQDRDKSRFERIKALFFKVAYSPLQKVLESQFDSLPHLAESLGKLPPQLNIVDPGFSINREAHEVIQNVFTHLLRNSLDHGIETPESREAKGKPPSGTINLKLSLYHDQLRIDYFDDGAGLNLNLIKKKALEKGLLSADKAITHRRLANMILEPDFSTAERVTDISGRGVGMDAVRSFIEEINGTFDIELAEPKSEVLGAIAAHFVMILPDTYFQRMEALQERSATDAA